MSAVFTKNKAKHPVLSDKVQTHGKASRNYSPLTDMMLYVLPQGHGTGRGMPTLREARRKIKYVRSVKD